MGIQEQLIVELDRRTHLLAEELAVWNQLTESASSGMGIHRSQIDAVELLYESFQQKLQCGYDNVVSACGTDAFQSSVMDLEAELTGAHGIIAVFRMILGQRANRRYFREALDAADLIAADCYQPCMTRATAMGVIDPNSVRVPPLTYLNSMYSPAAISRAGTFGAFRMPIESRREERMPIGVVSLPFHHTTAVWTFCSIYHEVGHLIDADLQLRRGLRARLDAKSASAAPSGYWSARLRELIADTFGVILGGEGYVRTMVKLLYQPHATVLVIDNEDVHPNPYLRILLLCELLAAYDAQAGEVAEAVRQEWHSLYGSAGDLEPPAAECASLAMLLLDEPLAVLGGRSIRELGPVEPSLDGRRVFGLSRYLRTGRLQPQLDDEGTPFPVRLVPAAAQLAVWAVGDDSAASFDQIHTRAFKFISELRARMPVFLGSDSLSAERRRSLRELAERMSLREP